MSIKRAYKNATTIANLKGPNAMSNETGFSHRHNPDGTVDSISRECFITVTEAQDETELGRAERLHACDPAVVAWYHERPNQLKTA